MFVIFTGSLGLWWSLCTSWMSSSAAKRPTRRSSSRRISVFATSRFTCLFCPPQTSSSFIFQSKARVALEVSEMLFGSINRVRSLAKSYAKVCLSTCCSVPFLRKEEGKFVGEYESEV